MTLGGNKNALERKYGTTEYWISYAKGILALKKPWLSEVKTAEYGLKTAARKGDRTAIVLLERLKNSKRYAKTYQT